MTSLAIVPDIRIRRANSAPPRRDGQFVLYWMIAQRRCRSNFGLQHAVNRALELGKPLVVLEALRAGYEWASDRLHKYVLDGMVENAVRLGDSSATYYPYVESKPGGGGGLVAALADRAAIVVTDDYPCFFLPRMVSAFARRASVRVEAVDANGLMPLAATPRDFSTAMAYRRFWQKELPKHWPIAPIADPLARRKLPKLAALPADVVRRWPPLRLDRLNVPRLLASLPIDHAVGVADLPGGLAAGAKLLRRFVAKRLDRYDEDRNDPDADGASGLSPYLHFGHLGSHEVFEAVLKREEVDPVELAERASKRKANGKREGWWGLSPSGEAFLDQLVTWRELGFVYNWHRPDYSRFSSLPDWAKNTLAKHARDPRPIQYDLAALESAATYDRIWNAAQREVVRSGQMHNYLRMLWGKKILEWSPSAEAALAVMIELNNKYALDGRDPNSYSGIFWVLGRFDRAWGPQRPIFGTIRYMSSDNTARKLDLKRYLERWS